MLAFNHAAYIAFFDLGARGARSLCRPEEWVDGSHPDEGLLLQYRRWTTGCVRKRGLPDGWRAVLPRAL